MSGRERASFSVVVNGKDVSSRFAPLVIDITVTDSSGESADTASITLDDNKGQISLPPIGAPITIGIGWGAAVELFVGVVDDVTSAASRSAGRTISISAKSADTVKSKLKEQDEKHMDDATLGDVAKKWGQEAGVEVTVHADLASIERKYWAMSRESFPAWAERTAKSVGATFKIFGTKAVMVPRSAGISASGKPLVPVVAREGDNLIGWSIKPALGRPQQKKFKTPWFDIKAAMHKTGDKDAGYETDTEAESLSRYSELDDAASGDKSHARERESDRERGGGTVDIDGDPSAQAEAPCILSGARPGVDGTYRIDSVTHKYARGGGFTTSLSLKQPAGGSGSDSRA